MSPWLLVQEHDEKNIFLWLPRENRNYKNVCTMSVAVRNQQDKGTLSPSL